MQSKFILDMVKTSAWSKPNWWRTGPIVLVKLADGNVISRKKSRQVVKDGLSADQVVVDDVPPAEEEKA